MYIPKLYETTDKAEIIAFMQQYSFATIVTVKDNFQTATHLPFVVEEKDDTLVLTSHFAKSNSQWEEIVNNNVLVIFNEPHAYISPKHYEKELNVPTWNYVAVHAYGKGRIITETSESFAVLEKMIESYDTDYKNQWNHLPQEYKDKMLKGIVAFDITVTDLQAKKKLSQNKTLDEQKRIAASLTNSNLSTEREIGELMNKHLPQ